MRRGLTSWKSCRAARFSRETFDDRKGAVEPLKLPPGPYEAPRVSPDGQRIAFGADDGKEAIVWIYDLSGATTMKALAFGSNNRFPTWSPEAPVTRRPYDITPDGRFVSAIPAGQSISGRLAPPQIQVVLNWFEELRTQVPAVK